MSNDTCPCCGYKTVSDEYDICEICRWEHDFAGERDPDSPGGANGVSLREAQRNFATVGIADPSLWNQGRKPGADDIRDPEWKRLDWSRLEPFRRLPAQFRASGLSEKEAEQLRVHLENAFAQHDLSVPMCELRGSAAGGTARVTTYIAGHETIRLELPLAELGSQTLDARIETTIAKALADEDVRA